MRFSLVAVCLVLVFGLTVNASAASPVFVEDFAEIAGKKVLVVEDGKNEALELSARNVPDLIVIRADSLNIVDVLDADAIVITAPSVPTMSEVYA